MAVPRGKEAILGSSANGNRSIAWHSCLFSLSVTFLVRLLLVACFLLLATFAVVTYPLLGAGDLLWGASFANLPKGAVPQNSAIGFQREGISKFNESFLAFAAIDPADESEKRKIKMILDGKVDDVREHNKRIYTRRMDHYMDFDRSRLSMRPRYESWLLQLQTAKFAESWPRFRQMLQNWSRHKHYDPLVMQELVEIVKKPLDLFYSERNRGPVVEEGKRYKTCAVVGNSGILLNRSFGNFIDSHDLVMRLNNAKVHGFEEFVGSKTTVSFVNSNIYHACSRRLKCFCHPYGEVPVVMYLCQVQHMMDVAFCGHNHRAPVLVIDPRLDNLCSRLVKWYSVKRFVETTGKPVKSWAQHQNIGDFHYSSGFQAIVLALGICEKVDIFGFGKSSQAKHHYHTNQRGELNLHDYAAEYLFYDDLVKNRIAAIPFLSEVSDFVFPKVEMFK